MKLMKESMETRGGKNESVKGDKSRRKQKQTEIKKGNRKIKDSSDRAMEEMTNETGNAKNKLMRRRMKKEQKEQNVKKSSQREEE